MTEKSGDGGVRHASGWFFARGMMSPGRPLGVPWRGAWDWDSLFVTAAAGPATATRPRRARFARGAEARGIVRGARRPPSAAMALRSPVLG